jgi:hypothetical protein
VGRDRASKAETETGLEPVGEAEAPASIRRRYHVALSPKEVLDRLAEQPGVAADDGRMLLDFGAFVSDAEFTLQRGAREFTLLGGPPAARGQSATGLLRLLVLRGRMTPTERGTLVELGFAYRRPRWALQRWIGLMALAGLGLIWVLVGPGVLVKKALLYGVLMLVLGPVIVHDLRRSERIEQQRRALLNLIERSFGSIQLDDPHPDEPYRRRSLAQADGDSDDDDDDDDDDDHPSSATTPENT